MAIRQTRLVMVFVVSWLLSGPIHQNFHYEHPATDHSGDNFVVFTFIKKKKKNSEEIDSKRVASVAVCACDTECIIYMAFGMATKR